MHYKKVAVALKTGLRKLRRQPPAAPPPAPLNNVAFKETFVDVTVVPVTPAEETDVTTDPLQWFAGAAAEVFGSEESTEEPTPALRGAAVVQAAVPIEQGSADPAKAMSDCVPVAVTEPTAKIEPRGWKGVTLPAGIPFIALEAPAAAAAVSGAASTAEVRHRCSVPGVIALAVDESITELFGVHWSSMLDGLAAACVPATFFITANKMGGDNANRRDLIRRTIADGHSLQHHTFAHGVAANIEELRSDLEQGKKELDALRPQETTRYFLPVDGKASPELLQEAWEQGLAVIGWSFSLQRRISAWSTVMTALQGFSPSEAGIIGMLHMHSSAEDTATLIPRMVAAARSLGWRFVTLDECLGRTERTA